MPATKQRPRRLSDAELGQLLALTTNADSVELKLTVPDSERRSTVTALGMDPLNAQIRQVYFFDTPDLTLDKHGVVVRARRVQQRADDSVVKLRPVVPSELPDSLRKAKNLVVEVDAMPGGYVCSASFKGTLGTTDVNDVAAGKRAIRKLYSKEQRAFFTAHAPDGRHRAGRAVGPGPDHRPQAQVLPRGIRPPAGRRAVVLPRRLTDP